MDLKRWFFNHELDYKNIIKLNLQKILDCCLYKPCFDLIDANNVDKFQVVLKTQF